MMCSRRGWRTFSSRSISSRIAPRVRASTRPTSRRHSERVTSQPRNAGAYDHRPAWSGRSPRPGVAGWRPGERQRRRGVLLPLARRSARVNASNGSVDSLRARVPDMSAFHAFAAQRWATGRARGRRRLAFQVAFDVVFRHRNSRCGPCAAGCPFPSSHFSRILFSARRMGVRDAPSRFALRSAARAAANWKCVPECRFTRRLPWQQNDSRFALRPRSS